MNNYFAKLLCFYSCSIEDFKISEAQVWEMQISKEQAQDTQAMVSWPPPCIPDRLCD